MFTTAVQDIIEDDGFKLPSAPATAALNAAKLMLQWCQCASNQTVLSEFSKHLAEQLKLCLPDCPTERDMLWRKYHTFRTSKEFFILWNQYLKDSIGQGSPIFFQHITHHMYKELIKQHFPAPQRTAATESVVSLTIDEQSAVYYAAGYIPRNLKNKLKRSAYRNKQDLQMCLQDVIEEDGMVEEYAGWTRHVNRGGLMKVNSSMFTFMSKMELVIKTFLMRHPSVRSDLKSTLAGLVSQDDEVKRSWDDVSSEWESDEASVLFSMITELWITMRGFGYASQWVEKWKQETKTLVQKTQGLRKKLNSD